MTAKQAPRNNPSKAPEGVDADSSSSASEAILNEYVEELLALSEGSGAVGSGRAFVKAASPVIRSKAMNRARFAIDAVKAGKKPGDPDLQAELEKRMRQTPQMNPLVTPDSYGVLASVSALVQGDPDMSAKVKRFYRAMVDNWVKSKLKTKSS